MGKEIERKYLVEVPMDLEHLGSTATKIEKFRQGYIFTDMVRRIYIRVNFVEIKFEYLKYPMHLVYTLSTFTAPPISSMYRRDINGFLITDFKSVVRIRIADDSAVITFKGHTTGISRDEYELPIEKKDAEILLMLMTDGYINKTRYTLDYKNNKWTVDVFDNPKGLILAEIELPDEKHQFEVPSWIGKDVTDDPSYTNVAIAAKLIGKL